MVAGGQCGDARGAGPELGFAVAAILGGLLASSGYLLLFLLDAATTLTFALVVYLKVPESHPGLADAAQARRRAPVLQLGQQVTAPLAVRHDGVFLTLLLLTFAVAVGFLQHISTLPVQMADAGLGARGFGLVISMNAVLIVLVTLPVSRRLQRFPPSRVLAASSVFGGLGFGATAWASTLPAYLLTVLVWTVGEVIGSSLAPAVVAELAPVQSRGRYQGALTSTFSLAAFAAPVGGGWVYDASGGGALWVGCWLLSFLAGAGHVLAGPARQRRLAQLRGPAPAAPGSLVTD